MAMLIQVDEHTEHSHHPWAQLVQLGVAVTHHLDRRHAEWMDLN